MKVMKVFAIGSFIGFGLLAMSFVTSTDEGLSLRVPDAMEQKVMNMAVENRVISQSEAELLIDANVMQQCVDAYVASGFEPSAAVDKLVKIAVEEGYFSDEEVARKSIHSNIEKLRKNEANWAKFYAIMGL